VGSDLTKLLDEWPYQPGQINVRLIEGEDGEPRVQLRLDLGIMQMRVDGRPGSTSMAPRKGLRRGSSSAKTSAASCAKRPSSTITVMCA
jgi:hypothetical protein